MCSKLLSKATMFISTPPVRVLVKGYKSRMRIPEMLALYNPTWDAICQYLLRIPCFTRTSCSLCHLPLLCGYLRGPSVKLLDNLWVISVSKPKSIGLPQVIKNYYKRKINNFNTSRIPP